MPSLQEALFNRSVAEILLPEYEQQTGIALRLVACDREFPDLVCESLADADREPIEIELVEVGLFFVNQENTELGHYEERFSRALSRYRAAYRNTWIRLQISWDVTAEVRPHRFPSIKSKEGELIVTEFEQLVGWHQDKLLPWSSRLLRELASESGSPALPTLLRHFDAISVHQMRETGSGNPHPDDPVVDLRSATQFNTTEIDVAVQRALRSKDKGASYAGDALVLHTLRADHKPYFLLARPSTLTISLPLLSSIYPC